MSGCTYYNIILFILCVMFSWFFNYHYYRKSLDTQNDIFSQENAKLTEALKNNKNNDRLLLRQKRIEECSVEYKRKGTPINIIDTYTDYTDEEKAELFDTVSMRVKGRKPKNNKYRH